MTTLPTKVYPETWEDWRRFTDRLSDEIGEWQGIPTPLGPENPIVLHDRHPLRQFFTEVAGGEEMQILSGGPADVDEDEEVVNCWDDRKRGRRVFVFRRKPSGRAFALWHWLPPDGAMDRLGLWLATLGASDGWDLKAEETARTKLRGLLSERQWRMYDMTGTFLETSKRSRVMYLFRRSRPTVALTDRWWQWTDGRRVPDSTRCLAVLCMHPVGYVQRSWGGCMVPSDDVIAHLLLMRADEAGYWKQANQHRFDSPEAGL